MKVVADAWAPDGLPAAATSLAKTPKPSAKRMEAAKEQDHAPYRSMAAPTMAAKGYWPAIPLDQAWIRASLKGVEKAAHASAIVVNCGWVNLRCSISAGAISGKLYTPPAQIL